MIGTGMLRIVLPMLLPFVAFFAWRLLVTRGRNWLASTPWFMLCVLSLLLAIGGFASMALIPTEIGSGRWIPPRVEDGRVVPGYVAPDPAPP